MPPSASTICLEVDRKEVRLAQIVEGLGGGIHLVVMARAGKADQRPMQALSTYSQSASDIAPMALATGPIIQRRAALRNLTRRHAI